MLLQFKIGVRKKREGGGGVQIPEKKSYVILQRSHSEIFYNIRVHAATFLEHSGTS